MRKSLILFLILLVTLIFAALSENKAESTQLETSGTLTTSNE
ncbi:MAG: hypothetical protein AAGC45_14230 [Bacteroidota bacterium]